MKITKTNLTISTRCARRCGSHVGDAFAIHATPQCRTDLIHGRTGTHLAVCDVVLQPALYFSTVPVARLLLGIRIFANIGGLIIQTLTQALTRRFQNKTCLKLYKNLLHSSHLLEEVRYKLAATVRPAHL